jgi:xanthine dehydrogenase YagS FAD-binding subunit
LPGFRYTAPTTLPDALAELTRPGAVPMGGGTDLLVTVREGIARPEWLVDLRRVGHGAAIDWSSDGSVTIGAATRIAAIAADPRLRERFPALAEACAVVGTPALRNMGTLGGNLCQRPRCWYYRRGIACHKNGGSSCPAAAGENQYHAILGGGPCHIVHPSDPAVALTALNARVHIAGRAPRVVPIEAFYVLPSERLDQETVLASGEMVSAIEIPGTSAGGPQRYDKIMQRGAWDFALVSLAAARHATGDVRFVLGGVAPRPWRVSSSVEEDVASGGLADDDIPVLAERALYDAEPLSGNAYKVALARTLLERAIRTLATT